MGHGRGILGDASGSEPETAVMALDRPSFWRFIDAVATRDRGSLTRPNVDSGVNAGPKGAVDTKVSAKASAGAITGTDAEATTSYEVLVIALAIVALVRESVESSAGNMEIGGVATVIRKETIAVLTGIDESRLAPALDRLADAGVISNMASKRNRQFLVHSEILTRRPVAASLDMLAIARSQTPHMRPATWLIMEEIASRYDVAGEPRTGWVTLPVRDALDSIGLRASQSRRALELLVKTGMLEKSISTTRAARYRWSARAFRNSAGQSNVIPFPSTAGQRGGEYGGGYGSGYGVPPSAPPAAPPPAATQSAQSVRQAQQNAQIEGHPQPAGAAGDSGLMTITVDGYQVTMPKSGKARWRVDVDLDPVTGDLRGVNLIDRAHESSLAHSPGAGDTAAVQRHEIERLALWGGDMTPEWPKKRRRKR